MNPGDLVVAVGGSSHVGVCRPENKSCDIAIWNARLYPNPSDWGTAIAYEPGTLGFVLCRMPPTGSGREWRRILLVSPVKITFGWMTQSDGWRQV